MHPYTNVRSCHIKLLLITIFCFNLIGMISVGSSQAQQETAIQSSVYHEIRRIGRGAILSADWRPGRNAFLVNSTQGGWIYTVDFEDVVHIENSRLAAFDTTGDLLARLNVEEPTISIWNIQEEKLITTLFFENDTNAITILTWSPSSKFLVAGGQDRVWIWDVLSGELINSFNIGQPINNIAFSPDEGRLAIGRIDNVDLYQLDDWHIILTLNGVGGAPIVAWHPNGHLVATLAAYTPASGISINSLKVWDAASGELKLVIQTELARSLAWNPDGTMLATDSSQYQGYFIHFVQFWNPITGEQIAALGSDVQQGRIHSIAWSSDGKHLLTAGEDNSIYLWNWPLDATQTHTILQLHMGEITSLAWNATKNQLANTSKDFGVHIWDIAEGALLLKLTSYIKDIWSVSWSPDGNHIAIGDGQEPIRIWDVLAEQEVMFLLGHGESLHPNIAQGVAATAWSPDGTLLASGGYDGTVRIWDISTGAELHTLQNRASPVLSVSWSNDNKHLISADGDVTLWDVQIGEPIQKYVCGSNGEYTIVTQSVFSPNGALVAGASHDSSICVWDAISGELIADVAIYGEKIAWNANSSKLAILVVDSESRKSVIVWDIATSKILSIINGQSDPTAITWIGDREEIAIGFADGTISIWDKE
jgi:WD40 repeat protein